MSCLKTIFFVFLFSSFYAHSIAQSLGIEISYQAGTKDYEDSLKYDANNISHTSVLTLKGIPANLDQHYLTRKDDKGVVVENKYDPTSLPKLKFILEDDIIDFFADENGEKSPSTLIYKLVDKSSGSDNELAEIKIVITADEVQTEVTDYPTDLVVPVFKQRSSDGPSTKRNSKLIINASNIAGHNKGNPLYNGKFNKSNSVRVGGSLTVLSEYLDVRNYDEITIELEGSDYSYESDLGSIYKPKESKKGDEQDDPKDDSDTESNALVKDDAKEKQLLDYILKSIEKLEEYPYLSIHDISKISEYTTKLEKRLKEHIYGKITLNKETKDAISDLMDWTPSYVLLTPISATIPDVDQVEVKLKFKKSGDSDPTEVIVANPKTRGGMAIAVNANLFITNLKNNDVFTDSLIVDEATGSKELRAIIEDDNQLSIGIGLNAEVSFRTGTIFRPLLNIGFFIPFEEEISPYLALGGGFSLGSKNVKLSVSSGLAMGSVNVVSEKYKDKDLSQYSSLTNENLTDKAWKTGWHFGVGVSYNLSKSEKKK